MKQEERNAKFANWKTKRRCTRAVGNNIKIVTRIKHNAYLIGEYEITLKSNKEQNALLISDPWCVKYPMNGIGSSDEEPHALEERQLMEGLKAG